MASHSDPGSPRSPTTVSTSGGNGGAPSRARANTRTGNPRPTSSSTRAPPTLLRPPITRIIALPPGQGSRLGTRWAAGFATGPLPRPMRPSFGLNRGPLPKQRSRQTTSRGAAMWLQAFRSKAVILDREHICAVRACRIGPGSHPETGPGLRQTSLAHHACGRSRDTRDSPTHVARTPHQRPPRPEAQ